MNEDSNLCSQSKLWRASSAGKKLEDLPTGLDYAYFLLTSFVAKLWPRRSKLLKDVKKIVALDQVYSPLSDEQLHLKIKEQRDCFLLGRESDVEIFHAFAIVREVAWRTLGMKPYEVQLMGGLAIERGYVAEMATGEGKTLTATLPGVIGGWRGRGCHVLTTNNYLACRDAEEMTPVYEFCGLTVAAMSEEMTPEERPAAYQADITYCTNKDVAADFLRDQLSFGHGANGTAALLSDISGIKEKQQVSTLRGLECAIIDEADSVLIDDGVTPLLISGESKNSELTEAFSTAASMASEMEEGKDYKLDEKFKIIDLLQPALEELQKVAEAKGGIWSGVVRRKELLNQALVVKHFFIRDKQYIIDEGKVVIVDEATGRLMPDRFWREGTHQAVEAKEELEINASKETYARISFQKFFRLYKKVSGMTGTAAEVKSELDYFYQKYVVSIPTNRPCLRKQFTNKCFISEDDKFDALFSEIEKIHSGGRPILIGTGSIKDSERISEILDERKLSHVVLNARYHRDEAEIVAKAGKYKAITVATNMAGRGTDIKLTLEAKEAGGLHVIATEMFESERIDRQLYGRASRQGDPGSAVALVSLEDPLIKRNLGLTMKLFKYLCVPFGRKIRVPGVRLVFFIAQKLSVFKGRRQRKGVMKSDTWLEDNLGFAGKEHT